MSSFTKPLTVTYLPDEAMWITERQFTYHIGSEDSIREVTVPKGFRTDFASIPAAFQWMIPKSGKYNQAAVLHDFLYTTMQLTKKESDLVFLEAMEVLKVNWFKRNLMYRAVRMNLPKARKWCSRKL